LLGERYQKSFRSTFEFIIERTKYNIFYAINLDVDCRLKNVFWMDLNGGDDYQELEDVILFDATYISQTNIKCHLLPSLV
jgi:hypothetical protein